MGSGPSHGTREPSRQEVAAVKRNHRWQGKSWHWGTIEARNGSDEWKSWVVDEIWCWATVKARSGGGDQKLGAAIRMAWWSTGYDLATCAAWYYQGGTKSAQGLTPDPMWHCSLTTSNDRRQMKNRPGRDFLVQPVYTNSEVNRTTAPPLHTTDIMTHEFVLTAVLQKCRPQLIPRKYVQKRSIFEEHQRDAPRYVDQWDGLEWTWTSTVKINGVCYGEGKSRDQMRADELAARAALVLRKSRRLHDPDKDALSSLRPVLDNKKVRNICTTQGVDDGSFLGKYTQIGNAMIHFGNAVKSIHN
ncbi:hypothetical protein F5887DRAFT_926166 [Amanita rubescens]|nr:hypothetical protein F5887DRAFT_926166 [Amanita rubescens]